VRVPEFVGDDLRASVNGRDVAIGRLGAADKSLLGESQLAGGDASCRLWGNYLELAGLREGDRVELSYGLPVTTEEVAVGNPGYRLWRYRVTWKGDTVVRVEPVGNDVAMAWSDFDKTQRQVYYGHEGPGPLYQREHMLAQAEPRGAELFEDDGMLDLWADLTR
jgi:hypothetical protein